MMDKMDKDSKQKSENNKQVDDRCMKGEMSTECMGRDEDKVEDERKMRQDKDNRERSEREHESDKTNNKERYDEREKDYDKKRDYERKENEQFSKCKSTKSMESDMKK